MDRTADELSRECIALRVRTLSREITRLYDDALRPLGLTTGQMSLLAASASLEPDATAERLSRALELETSTLSRNLALLARRGWLEPRPRKSGRGSVWRPTPAGRARLRRARRPWARAQGEAKAVLARYGITRLLHPLLDGAGGESSRPAVPGPPGA